VAGTEPHEESEVRTESTDRSLWTSTKVSPVEIALPAGVGYTLRAYRLSNELHATDVEGREEDEDLFAGRAVGAEEDDDEVVILDEEFAALAAEGDEGEATTTTGEDKPADEDDAGLVEEVPFFLTHRGKLLLFKSPESLAAFVRSGAPHDLSELDTWSELAEKIQPADIVADPEDLYELDLVVENLRGGHDTWDMPLIIRAGEAARDLGHALRLPAIVTAMSPGSPLDDLDEAMRAASEGGMKAFFGNRRMRKIGAQQASLGWRTIIGKISAVVDWRD